MDLANLPKPNEPVEAWRGRFVAAMAALSLEDLAEWSGGTLPASPFAGQLFYHTGLDEVLYYDATRAKWLATAAFPVVVAWRGNWPTSTYGVHMASMQGSATTGHPVPFPATITSYAHRLGSGSTGNFEIHVNGSNVQAVSHGAANLESNAVDVDVAKGDVLTVYNAGSTVSDAQVQLLLRRTVS